jgi:hypothetical protein
MKQNVGDLTDGVTTDTIVEDGIAHFEYFARRAMNVRRSLCITKGKRLCFVTTEVKQGDVVAMLYGGEYLYALRPYGYAFTLVVNAYIHGLMDGEAVDNPVFKLQVFKII